MFEELEAAMSNIQKLEEEKKKIQEEAEETKDRLEKQIEQVEKTLDEERKTLVADVSRGKAEVLKLMQVMYEFFVDVFVSNFCGCIKLVKKFFEKVCYFALDFVH